MEFVRNFARRLTNRLFKDEEPSDVKSSSRINAYLNHVYKILLWEDPKNTWTVFGLVHVLFWLIAYLELRLLGLFFISALALLLIDTYFEYRGLEEPQTSSSDAVRQVATITMGIYQHMMNLRRESHAMFCGLMCLGFLLLSVIAKNVDGYLLAYLCLLFIFFGPLLASKLPPRYVQHFKSAVRTISSSEGMLAERELIPFLSDKDRSNTELDSLDGKQDSISSSLVVGISSMPSYHEAESSIDGLDEEDLELPAQTTRKYISAPEEEYSSESELDERNIDFDSAHFNGDTSSDEEGELGKNMKFSEEYTKEYIESLNKPESKTFQEALVEKMGETMLGNLASAGTSFLSNLLPQKAQLKPSLSEEGSTSSNSDFEMIGSDDLGES